MFTPILDRYDVLPQDRPYIMAFYIRGLMAIISEWLKNDCADSITYVTSVIQQCVKMPQSETMKFYIVDIENALPAIMVERVSCIYGIIL